MSTSYQHFPKYLKARGFKAVDNHMDTALMDANGIKDPAFVYFEKNPHILQDFGLFMGAQRGSQPSCFDVYDFKAKTKGLDPEQPFFVDIGGGMGHQCVELRRILPDLPNKVILQDQAGPISVAIKHPGVTPVEQNFFEPQNAKGARIYYMRNIMHDYADDKATEILNHTRAAMGQDPEAVLLIDDMVLPDTGCSWQAAQLDIHMMTCLAAKERNLTEWKALLAKAGLQIRGVHEYTPSIHDAIIECVPAS